MLYRWKKKNKNHTCPGDISFLSGDAKKWNEWAKSNYTPGPPSELRTFSESTIPSASTYYRDNLRKRMQYNVPIYYE